MRLHVLGLGLLVWPTAANAQDACFERLDNGVDMTGWHQSATNHHGPGDGWSIENGAFVGRQTGANLGGILMTDKSYSDVEVKFEVKIDWGCDSGFFFRTTAGDRAYQVNVDFLDGAGVGTIYGEGFNTELRYRPYTLSNMGDTATAEAGQTPIFDVSQWTTIWHKAEFNELYARVENNPPHIQVWINDTKVTDFTDQTLRAEIEPMGPLAIQVHGGAARWVANGSVQFKNIRVRDLTQPCDEPDPGTGGASDGGAGPGDLGGIGGASGGAPGAGQAIGGSTGPTGGAGGSAGVNGLPSGGSGAGYNPGYGSGDDSGESDDTRCACRTVGYARSWPALVALLGVAAAFLRRRFQARG